VEPGYDGLYGKISLFPPEKKVLAPGPVELDLS
jgi:hypothetical protein